MLRFVGGFPYVPRVCWAYTFCVVRLFVLFKSAVPVLFWQEMDGLYRVSFFLDEGKEEEAYFFFSWVCAPQIERGEWGGGVAFVAGSFGWSFWSKKRAEQRINDKTRFPPFFLHETSTHETPMCIVHTLWQSSRLLRPTADDLGDHIMNERLWKLYFFNAFL